MALVLAQDMNDVLNRLTENIRAFGQPEADWKDDVYIHSILGADLAELRNYSETPELIKNWQYKENYEYTVAAHENEEKVFKLMEWDHSFAVTMLFAEYH